MDVVRHEPLSLNIADQADLHLLLILVLQYEEMVTELVLSNVMMEIMLVEMAVVQHELLNLILYDLVVLHQQKILVLPFEAMVLDLVPNNVMMEML